MLRGLETAMVSLDLQHIPPEMQYSEHFKLAVYVQPSRCSESACCRRKLSPEYLPTHADQMSLCE